MNHSSSESNGPAPLAGLSMSKRVRRMVMLIPFGAMVLALHLLREKLKQHSPAELLTSIGAVPTPILGWAVAFTGLAYLTFSAYDWLALRYVASSIRYRTSAPISVVSYGIGNMVGFPLFTTTPLRFRFYTAAGLTGNEIIRVISFTMLTSWLGLFTIASCLLLSQTQRLAFMSGYPATGLRVLGFSLLAVVVAYLVVSARPGKALRLGRWQIERPNKKIAFAQLIVASLDWLLMAAAAWVLFPKGPELGVPTFLAAFLLAQLLAMISHVPGGLGVFEAGLVLFLSPWAQADAALASLLLFRVVYYFLPFALSLFLVVFLERKGVAEAAGKLEERAAPWLGPVVPRALAVATFCTGAFLLVSGSLPVGGRLRGLGDWVPLGLIESSHLIASVAGLSLLVLARGLARRLDGAWHATVWMLGIGAITALLRAFDWEEALVLSCMAILLLLSKRHFYRQASLLSRPFSPRWLLGLGLVVASGVWLGLIVHGNAEFSQDQLWNVSLDSELPRFLRAQVAIAVGILVLSLARLFRGAPPTIAGPVEDDLKKVRSIVARAPATNASLALLGDKHFLFDPSRSAFVMFGTSGDSWISMGDPVGDPVAFGDLIWRFREQCDRYDERPVFYQVRPQYLSLYLEAGLSVVKLGESARTSLEGFSLEGSHRKDLRQSMRKAERENLTFDVVPQGMVQTLLPEMREVSDEWLQDKGASEKAFSLGNFNVQYLSNFPCAVVKRGDRLLAFANVLVGAENRELSVDLMRYRGEAPPGVMDYLFAQLMLWGTANRFHHFNLGMAPLSGLDQHVLAPTWNRIGALVFRHGEHFYNFQGLRNYKEKFTPTWEPRYLVAPEGLATGRALLDVATLIAGGVAGLFRR